MIYYRRYIGAYQKRTTRLSMRDHGAYGLMLDFYYAEEQPLPLEMEDIYDICKARTPDDRKSVQKVLRLHFERGDDGYHNERADEEIAAAQQARRNGSKGGRPRSGDDDETGGVTGNRTGPKTGSGTGEQTKHGTEKGGGSVHPSTFNHSAVQPSASNHQPHTRAGEIAVLLRNLARKCGKTVRIGALDRKVIDWAHNRISDQHLTEAFDLAVQDRENRGEKGAITPGFVDVFLCKLLNPNQKGSGVNGSGKPWFIDTWQAIVAKGEEKGLKETDYETPPAFKAAVLAAHGVTADQVQKAEADWR